MVQVGPAQSSPYLARISSVKRYNRGLLVPPMPAPGPQPPHSDSEPLLDPARPPRIIAHRGLSGLFPENTLRAFGEALAAGAGMVELDVTKSRDGALVVFHDVELDRTTDGSGRVSDQNLADLKGLDAGSWFAESFAGERIPTLEEALDLIGPHALLNVEIKEEAVDDLVGGVVERVIEAIGKAGILRRVLLSSFEPEALVQSREIDPSVPRASLFNERIHRGRRPIEIMDEVGAVSLNLSRDQVSRGIVEECHAHDRLVLVYTVNDPEEMGSLFALGVDGLFTDRADLGLALENTSAAAGEQR